MFKILVLNLVIIASFFISCNPASNNLSKDEMRKIVEERNTALGDCFKNSDIEKLALIYSDSAKLSPDGREFVFGRDSIKAFWGRSFKTSKTLDMKTEVLTIDGDENVIYETGKTSSKILYEDSLYNVTVKYINVWTKQKDGSYKLDVDFWNRNKR